MKTKYIIQLFMLFFIICFTACKKGKYYEGAERDLDKIKEYNNEYYSASEKMNLTESISHITAQKLQEIYDLSILAAENKSNKDIDTVLISQLRGYFSKRDTTYVYKIINTLDSLQAKYVKIELEKQNTPDSIILKDSIGNIQFRVHFYDKNKKYFSTQETQAHYILKRNPEKFKKEFKFYFSSIGNTEKPKK